MLERIAAAAKQAAAAKASPASPAPSSSSDSQKATEQKAPEVEVPFEKGMKYYKSGAPGFKFLVPGYAGEVEGNRVVFTRGFYKTANITLQELLRKDFIRRGFVVEVKAIDFYTAFNLQSPNIVDVGQSTIRTGQVSGSSLGIPATVSVAGKK